MRPPTAVAVSFPEAASMRNWVAAPKAAPPGTTRLMAFPASCDVATENQALVRSAIRCSAMVQAKCATCSDDREGEPDRVERRQLRQGAKTSVRLGNTR